MPSANGGGDSGGSTHLLLCPDLDRCVIHRRVAWMLFYAICWIIVFWLVIHVLYQVSGRLWRRSPVLLPAPFSSGRQVHNVILGVAHLRVETTRYNAPLSALPFILDGRLRSPLTLLYNCGGALGVVGMIGSVVVLLWQAYNLIFVTHLMQQAPAPRIMKRDVEIMAEPQGDAPYLHSMVIPGLTIPLADFPFILTALFLSQIYHEFGHAVAASLDTVQLLSAGFAVHLFIPSAFVSLSAHSLASLRHLPRIRIATAGALHNIGLWFVVTFLILRIDGSTFWDILGWKDVSRQGVVVHGVDWGSPLYLHLPPSSIITRLDDFRLGENNALWRTYLISSHGETSGDLGWCVPKGWYEELPSTCCRPDHPTSAEANYNSCFVTVHTNSTTPMTERCVDPVPLFTARTRRMRRGVGLMYKEQEKYHNHDKVPDSFAYGSRCHIACMTADEDDGPHLCIRPRADPERDTRLLRLGVTPPPWEQPSFAHQSMSNTVTKTVGGNPTEYVLIWSGPTSEILDHVHVGRRQPHFSWLPASIPELWGLFLEYLATINLSLFFFNLLPISILDGGVVLGVVLDTLGGRFGRSKETTRAEIYDIDSMMESGEARDSHVGGRRWRRPLEKGIGYGTMGLGAFVLLGTLWRDLG